MHEDVCRGFAESKDCRLITDVLNSEEQKRLDEIKKIFVKNKVTKGDDKLGQMVMVLSNLTENLEVIKNILGEGKVK